MIANRFTSSAVYNQPYSRPYIVCSNANRRTITLFRFRARWIDGISVVYFLIMHCLGRPHYVWEEYLYSVIGN